MIIEEAGADEERFLVLGAWNVVTGELLTKDEFEQRGISYDTLSHIFPTLEMPMFDPPCSHRDPHLHLHHIRDPLTHLRLH